MKKQLIFLLFLFISSVALAQKFEVPKNYVLQTDEDYQKYQPDVLKAIDWFAQTPWNEKRIERGEIGEFMMNWIEGCPYVEVETSDVINELGNTNYDLLVSYFAGYTKYLLLNPGSIVIADARMAGMKALFAKYQKDKEFKRDKKVEQLIKLDADGGLSAWLHDALDD